MFKNLEASFREKNFYLTTHSLPLFLVGQVNLYKKLSFICQSDKNMEELKVKINSIDDKIKVLTFPTLDSLLFSDISPTNNILNTRINTLFKLTIMKFEKIICLINESSILFKCVPKDNLKNKYIIIDNKKLLTQNDILNFLNNNNYQCVDSVRQVNEYCIRGSLIDIFPSNLNYPLRLDFFGEYIESIRIFDPVTQLTKKKVEKSYILPANEFFLDSENVEKFRINFRNTGLKKKIEFYNSISNKIPIAGMHNFYSFFYDKLDSIINYLDNFLFICSNNIWERLSEEEEKIKESFYKSEFFEFFEVSKIMDKSCQIKKLLKTKELKFVSHLENFGSNKEFYHFSNSLNLSDDVVNKRIEKTKKIINKCRKIDHIVFTYRNNSSKTKLLKVFENTFQFFEIDSLTNLKQNKICLFNNDLKKSFVINSNDKMNYYFLSDQDIFGLKTLKATKRKINAENILMEMSNFRERDLVVHSEHGIGRFSGLKNIKLYDQKHECIEVEYSGGDKIFIPVENLDLITKYGHEDLNVSLDKLGSKNWQLRKAGIKNKIKLIANDLLKIAAERKLKKGIKMFVNHEKYTSFASEFEFAETSDQISAINDIENDLISGKPMDRLICGDVGFGKTEVAMRASFIVANSGYQVAFICPTTLLVRQHYKNFSQRFKGTGILIEKLSRFEKKSDRQEILKKLKKYNNFIIIGTHALFNDDIEFKNLGLLVIDEEQSFGVEQKEKIKKFRSNIHILTLTATPIPRTLQFSVLGIKDISLITTPPSDRVPIKTFLTKYDTSTIRSVITNEVKRGGQLFYITPRIKEIPNIKKRLTNIVPDCKIGIVHGRLKSENLNSIYEDFFRKKIDILISTSIIESGIDIPNANTIIVEKPNFFGLSQIYQIRGRVGRSDKQAYAFFIIDYNNKISKKAEKRLDIINNLENLGAGFQLASYDLDLRGSGNILGVEQSGHIKEVGFELYQKLIKDSIDDLRNVKSSYSEWSPQINLGLPTLIPENYIKEVDIRLSFYRRISNTYDVNKLKLIFNELQDRFGKLPKELINLSIIIKIKNLCKIANIKKIDLGSKGVIISFREDPINAEKVIEIVRKNPDNFKIRPNNKLLFFNIWNTQKDKINDIIQLLKTFSLS